METYLWYILGALICFSMVGSLVGLYAYFQSKSLYNDVLAHAVLPGVVIAFLFQGEKNPLSLFVGALLAAACALFLLDRLAKHPKISEDASLAIVLSTFFAFGLLGISYVNHSGISNGTGLKDFVFGKITDVTKQDFYWILALSGIVGLLLFVFRNVLFIYCFQAKYLDQLGFNRVFILRFFQVIQITCVALGIQMMGLVMMSAFLLFPIVISKQLSKTFKGLLFLSIGISIIAVAIGFSFSLKLEALSTGPLIILILASIMILTILLKRIIKY